MAITSSAGDGIRLLTAAKESEGNAATLGSQAGAEANEVIVPDAITVNNEGNLAASPSYVGRMFCLRPWEVRLAIVPEIVAGGTGHAVNDVITLSGVAGIGGAPQVRVTAVSGGVITAISLERATALKIRRPLDGGGGMTSSPSPTNNPVAQSTTTGSGVNATFDCFFERNFELRYIVTDTSNTLTVHEDWEVPPASGDNWAISYILDDVATLNGLTLRAQSGVYEATRIIRMGNSTLGTRFGWLAMVDGVQLELDNVSTPAETLLNGVLTIGYIASGKSVSGAYISTSDASAVPNQWLMTGIFFLYDVQGRSPRRPFNFTFDGNDDTDEGGMLAQSVGEIFKDSKMFDSSHNSASLRRHTRIENVVYEAGGTDAAADYKLLLGTNPQLYGLTLVNIAGGLESNLGSFMDGGMRNIQWVGQKSDVLVDTGNDWILVNPVWNPDYESSTSITQRQGSLNELKAQVSIIIRTQDSSGNPLSDVAGHVYDGMYWSRLDDDDGRDEEDLMGALAPTNTARSLSSAYDPKKILQIVNDPTDPFYYERRFISDLEPGDICYRADAVAEMINRRRGETVGGRRNILAWRGYKYGFQPAVIPLINSTDDVPIAFANRGFDLISVIPADSVITESDRATALTNPTVTPTITKHGPGETDPRPMKALKYDAGVGSVPTIGETMTQGSATGAVVNYEGSATSGLLLLESWNGVEFTDNQNITGGTSTFDATTNLLGGTGFYEEYTWEIDAGGEAMTVLYDYLMAYMSDPSATPPTTALEMIAWGGNEPDALQMLYLGTNGWYTNRAEQLYRGQLKSGITPDFTDDFNRADENLSVSSDWTSISASASDSRVVSNELQPANSQDQFTANDLALASFTPTIPFYVQIEVATLPTADRDDEQVAIYVGKQTNISELVGFSLVSWQNAPAFRVYLAEYDAATDLPLSYTFYSLQGYSGTMPVPVVGDIMRIVCVEAGVYHFFVNDRCVGHYSDVKYQGFEQVGVWCKTSGNATFAPNVSCDNFECGNLTPATDFKGEGVFIHDRGAGDIAYFTSDDGTQYVPEATVTLTVQGVSEGTSVKVIAAETVGSVTAGDILMEKFANASGVAETTLIYESAWNPSGLDVYVRARNQGIAVAAIAANTGGTVFVDETTEANSSATNDINLLPSSPAANDAYYFGHNEQFSRLKLDISDANGTGSTITWEYWNGLAWAALSGVTDGTSNFETSGENIVSWTIPGGWSTTSVNSQGPLYYVRARLSTVGSANQTRARKCTLDTTRYLPFPQTGFAQFTITDTGLTVAAVWTEDTIAKFDPSD